MATHVFTEKFSIPSLPVSFSASVVNLFKYNQNQQRRKKRKHFLDVGSYIPILSIFTILSQLVAVGIVYGCGNSSLAAHIVFTIISVITCSIILFYSMLLLHKGFTGEPVFFKFTFTRLCDTFLAIYLGWSFLIMLFWIWGQDQYIQNIGNWEESSAWLVWQRSIYITILAAAIGYGTYVPQGTLIEVFILILVIFQILVYGVLIGSFFAMSVLRRRSEEKRKIRRKEKREVEKEKQHRRRVKKLNNNNNNNDNNDINKNSPSNEEENTSDSNNYTPSNDYFEI